MKSISAVVIVASVIVSFLLSACSDNNIEPNPTVGLIKVGEGYALGAGTKVELWADEVLFAGYNKLYVALYDSINGERITESHVSFNPIMSMEGGMRHSCPTINPQDENAVNQLFPGAAIFTMPGSGMSFWTMGITVHNHHNEKFGKASMTITVVNPPVARVKSFVTGNNDKLVVAYHFPAQAKVGVNDFALAIYKMESGDFIPDAAYSVILRPEMPSMDHGSPNNVDPVYHDTEGMYAGKVNFTMTGEWRLNLTLEKADQSVPLFFDVTLN